MRQGAGGNTGKVNQDRGSAGFKGKKTVGTDFIFLDEREY
jgi:hypothetical protein